jgi:LmbE family N-acetylglucosaminyl deacetylase
MLRIEVSYLAGERAVSLDGNRDRRRAHDARSSPVIMLDAAAVTHVVLSPHLDDAALSIGGLIARLTAAGAPIRVVTIAAGSPPSSAIPSPLAESFHRAWGLPSTDAVASRRREDDAAMAILGAEAVRLGQLDAVYRRPDRYDTEAALFGEPAGDDRLEIEVIAALGSILAASPRALVLAPLAVGGHVDHRLVHRAARDLASQGREVAFYEDLPYATKPGSVAQRRAAIGAALAPETFDIAATIDRKIEAIFAYTSQLDALFGGRDQARAVLTSYARSVGGDAPAERIWHLR